MLPKRSIYVKGYGGETKWLDFQIKDDELIKIYNDIGNKVSKSMKKELNSEPINYIKNCENQKKI